MRQQWRGGAGDGRRGRGREAAWDRVPPVDPEQASGVERSKGSGRRAGGSGRVGRGGSGRPRVCPIGQREGPAGPSGSASWAVWPSWGGVSVFFVFFLF